MNERYCYTVKVTTPNEIQVVHFDRWPSKRRLVDWFADKIDQSESVRDVRAAFVNLREAVIRSTWPYESGYATHSRDGCTVELSRYTLYQA